jgi:hypothetical protein
MAHIVIKDLKEGVELDREAMRQITGGGGWRRQRLSALPGYESSLFQKPAPFDHFNRAGFDFAPNQW